MTTNELLQARVNELTDDLLVPQHKSQSSDRETCGAEALEIAPASDLPVLFKVCGLVTWGRARSLTNPASYQVAILLLTIAASAFVLTGTAQFNLKKVGSSSERGWLISEVALALGAIFGLLLLWGWTHIGGLRHGPALLDTVHRLRAYAKDGGFDEKWQKQSKQDMRLLLLVWLAALLVDVIMAASAACDSAPVHIIAVAFLRGVILCVTGCLIYVCRSLVVSVDMFCGHVVDRLDLDFVSEEWNVLHAVLRKASSSLELCFVVLHGAAAFTVPALMADFVMLGSRPSSLPVVLPGALATCGVLRALMIAASVTDKCTRVPTLINSLSFGPFTERKRQHAVDYIVSSAAGFYVCDVRLTASMALKFMYTWSVVAVGLGTQIVSSS